jgi:enoyl-CoA hydratase
MADVAFDRVGKAGVVTLARPKALNALSEPMIHAIAEALDEWALDDRVERVAFRGEGKAFCAGGDVRAVYEARAGARDFFAAEYRNNYRIGVYAKPVVSLIDGICMGGGVGISAHGSHRVASENLLFAMPETGIGLFPDVGATHLLARMEGEAGMHLALTGDRIGRDTAHALGFVTHPVAAERMDDALDRTAHARDLDAALGDLVVETAPRDREEAAVVDEAFAADGVEAILDRLDAMAGDSAFAAQAAATIRSRSPTSVLIAHEQMRRAADASLAECLVTDFRIVSRVLDGHDFYEGIRAVLVDKDQAPRWSPATLSAVDRDFIAEHFEEPSGGDLDLPESTAR